MLFFENLDEGEERNQIHISAVGSLTSCIFLPGSQNLRLKLDLANNQVFSEYLTAPSRTTATIRYREKSSDFAASHKLLQGAVARIRARLERFYLDYESRGIVTKFKELISFVLLKIELVEIQVESNVTIYQIFENINDRGLHLSASDKFKNLYCSLLPNEQIDRFEKEWFDISKLVHAMGLDIEHFFDFYFRSNGKDDEGDFYKQFRKDISSKSSKNDKLKE